MIDRNRFLWYLCAETAVGPADLFACSSVSIKRKGRLACSFSFFSNARSVHLPCLLRRIDNLGSGAAFTSSFRKTPNSGLLHGRPGGPGAVFGRGLPQRGRPQRSPSKSITGTSGTGGGTDTRPILKHRYRQRRDSVPRGLMTRTPELTPAHPGTLAGGRRPGCGERALNLRPSPVCGAPSGFLSWGQVAGPRPLRPSIPS